LSAYEIYDFVATATPDSTVEMNLTAIGVVRESGSINQIVHLADDGSEEIVALSTAKEFYLDIPWSAMQEADAGTIFDFWGNATLGNGKMRSFIYVHEYGSQSHKYVTRFESDIARDILEGNIHNMSIRLKVKGRIPD
jgi:hypothetical protein